MAIRDVCTLHTLAQMILKSIRLFSLLVFIYAHLTYCLATLAIFLLPSILAQHFNFSIRSFSCSVSSSSFFTLRQSISPITHIFYYYLFLSAGWPIYVPIHFINVMFVLLHDIYLYWSHNFWCCRCSPLASFSRFSRNEFVVKRN